MELQLPSLTLIWTFVLFLFIVYKILLHKPKNKNSIQKNPPGPWKLPFIGNLHQIMGSSLPHHRLNDLAKKYGPLMHLQLGEVSTIVVSSPEMAQEVMKTHDIIFAQRPHLQSFKITSYDFKDIAVAPYGDYWRQMRKICTIELLSAKRVQSFKSLREEEVSNFIKSIHVDQGLVMNLSEKIFALTYGVTSRAAFGRKCKDQEAFVSVVTEAMKVTGGFWISDFYPSSEMLQVTSGMKQRLKKIHKESDRILQGILNDHKERRAATTKTSRPGRAEDLIDVFLELQQDGDFEFALTDDNIKAVILDIFAAGSETSSTTVEWAMSELLRNPRLMEEAQAEVRQVFDGKRNVDETGIHELKFLKSVIKETLRLHPAAPLLLPRESRERCEIHGFEIPIKSRVIINAWAIGRDPKYWSEAERFHPERFLDSSFDYKGKNFQYIPFGSRRRICLGILFALPNIELPLAQLLYHFDWKLPNGMKHEGLDMTEVFGVTVRRKNDLLLTAIPYRP